MQADAYSSEVGRSYPRSSRHRMNASGRDWDQACWVCQFDKLTGCEELKPGRNIELDPTLTYSRTDEIDGFPDGDLEEAEDDTELGLTARWGITPSLALTGTVNPDFSQVEADVAQLDVNERFALFFPETQTLFTQLLFSYTVNARTVLFLGYSDNQLGLEDVDLTRTDRTVFFKVGYAWIL